MTLFVAAAPPLKAQDVATPLKNSFQGEVDYSLADSQGNTGTLCYFSKPGAIRIEVSFKNKKEVLLIDVTEDRFYSLLPDQKMFRSSTPANAAWTLDRAQGELSKGQAKLELLGKPCEPWEYQSKYGRTLIWAAADMGNFILLQMPGASFWPESTWAEAVRDRDLFPLKVVSTDKKGKATVTLTALKLSTARPDDGLFLIPAGYQSMETGQVLDKPGLPDESSGINLMGY